MRVSRRGWALALALSACASPAAETFHVAVGADGEDGKGLAGVQVWIEGRRVGTSDARGRVDAEWIGRSGDRVTLAFTCPPGHGADVPTRTLALRRTTNASGVPAPIELGVACRPLHTLAPLVVVASGDDDLALPVTLDGRVLTHTDATGSAHALVELEPGAVVRVGFDTSSRPELRPQSPVRIVRFDSADAILIATQRFEVARPRPRRVRNAPKPAETPSPEAHRPYRIH